MIRNAVVADGEDLYSLLGLNRSAYQADVRRAFRLWGLRFHPARGGDATAFGKLCNAWEVLGDEDRKDRYDRYGFAALGWDGGFAFSSPELVFRNFFRRFGGSEHVASFLQSPCGAGWTGWEPFWSGLVAAMPQLEGGMSCCGEFAPGGETHPTPRAPQQTSFSGAAAAAADAGGWAATPAPLHSSSFRSVDAAGGLARSDSMKAQYLEQWRMKKSGSVGNVVHGAAETREAAMQDAGVHEAVYSIAAHGMQSKAAALAEYRARKTSSAAAEEGAAAGLTRRSSLHELRFEQQQQLGETELRSKWLASYRAKGSA